MPTPIFRVLLLILLFVSFLGQAMVFSFSKPCGIEQDELNLDHGSVMQLTIVDTKHSEEEECCDVDCCDLNCICAANSCSMLTFTISNSEHVIPRYSSVLVELYNLKPPSSIQLPLYRPPINA